MAFDSGKLVRASIAQHLEVITGYVAWAIVCYLTLSTQQSDVSAEVTGTVITLASLLSFIIGFYFSTREEPYGRYNNYIRVIAIAAQILAMVVLKVLANPANSVIAILAVVISAQLPYHLTPIKAWLTLAGLVLFEFVVNFTLGEKDQALIYTGLAAAFNIFAFRIAERVIQEQEAREEITALNRELIATQALLQESSKQSERLRISRDLHDGLGHHLTALILKLQYLTHTTTGENQQHVAHAHGLAKQLLTDVRETVHQMREQTNIGLKDALEALVAQIPDLKFNLDIQENIGISDVTTAETLFRCVQEAITNTLKHGNASEMNIVIKQENCDITLQVSDNGQLHCELIEGNGLKGMRERLAKLSGQLNIQTNTGFNLSIRIPLAGETI